MEEKTKKVAVIEFFEVPEDVDDINISWESFTSIGGLGNVDVVDIDRLRYGVVKEGDTFLGRSKEGHKLRKAKLDGKPATKRLIIDPPKPELETLEQVLDRMPNYGIVSVIGYVEAMAAWRKDFAAAMERDGKE